MKRDLLVMQNITKVYPNGFVANSQVDFSVKEGEIHALVGENGAGKSTLMKILFGEETPEEGKIILKDEEVKITSQQQAISLGIGMVYQHFMLVPSLTVAENMVMGMEPKRFGFLDFKKACEMTEEVGRKYNLYVDPRAKVCDLPVGMKQRVEILKSLLRGAKILILDEPTAVLTPQETKELFVELKALKDRGHTIIFISHKLKEIKALCDRITILRQGKSMGVHEVSKVTEEDISRLMVGRDVVLKVDKTKAKPKETVLQVEHVSLKGQGVHPILKDVSFSVRRGEILGIAGVEGNGQRELSEMITGLLPCEAGDIRIERQSIKKMSVKKIRELGTSHISEDRMTYGCIGDASILENMIADRYYKKEYNRYGLLNGKKLVEEVNQNIEAYKVKCDDHSQPIKMLSGGNMQKVVVAREFSSDPDLIIINQPTRGVDVGAIEFIHKKVIELRDQGKGILLISADLNEVLELSDSLIVMYEGEIAAYCENAKTMTEEMLGEYMLGIKKQTPEEIRRAYYD